MAESEIDVKKPWESKTLWVSAIVALAPLYPPIGALVAANPEWISMAVGAIFAGLRMITNTGVK